MAYEDLNNKLTGWVFVQEASGVFTLMQHRDGYKIAIVERPGLPQHRENCEHGIWMLIFPDGEFAKKKKKIKYELTGEIYL